MTKWLDKAFEYNGEKEIAGRQHNPKIIELWEHAKLPFKDDETPWCAGFVGGVLEQVGIKGSRSGMARSYLKWGKKLTNPLVGAVVVLKRGPAPYGHVGFVTQITQDKIKVLGGNQSNEVNETWFKRSDVLGYRWPNVPVEGAKPIMQSKIGAAAVTVGAVEATDAAVQVDQAVKNTPAPSLDYSSIMDYTLDLGRTLSTSPRFLIGVGVIVIAGLIWYWRRKDHS